MQMIKMLFRQKSQKLFQKASFLLRCWGFFLPKCTNLLIARQPERGKQSYVIVLVRGLIQRMQMFVFSWLRQGPSTKTTSWFWLPPLGGAVALSFFFIITTLFLLTFLANIAKAEINITEKNLNYFATIPISYQGRIQPLDSFAQKFLLSVAKQKTLEEKEAIFFLAELLFDEKKAFFRKIFKISNPDILHLMKLPKNSQKKYSFLEVFQFFAKIMR